MHAGIRPISTTSHCEAPPTLQTPTTLWSRKRQAVIHRRLFPAVCKIIHCCIISNVLLFAFFIICKGNFLEGVFILT